MFCRLRSCEQAIGLMKNMQSSLEVEEKFVDGAIESLESLPTATATHELDVSIVEFAMVLIKFRLFVELYISSSTLHIQYVLIPCTPAIVSEMLPNEISGLGPHSVCASEFSCIYENPFKIVVSPKFIYQRVPTHYFN